jgi:hypothetical protein
MPSSARSRVSGRLLWSQFGLFRLRQLPLGETGVGEAVHFGRPFCFANCGLGAVLGPAPAGVQGQPAPARYAAASVRDWAGGAESDNLVQVGLSDSSVYLLPADHGSAGFEPTTPPVHGTGGSKY